MNSLQRLQVISRLFRYLLLGFGTLIVGAVGIALLVTGQEWLSIGNEHLAQLVQAGDISGAGAVILLAPVGVIFVLGIYWLQRLFGAYAAGRFFTDESMRCYLWLVWRKVASFVYQLTLPILMGWFAAAGSAISADVVVDVSTLAELMVLLLIVHILREAQRLNEENKGFV